VQYSPSNKLRFDDTDALLAGIFVAIQANETRGRATHAASMVSVTTSTKIKERK